MALAVVLGVIFAHIRKKGVGQEAAGRRLPASSCRPTRCSTVSCLWASCFFFKLVQLAQSGFYRNGDSHLPVVDLHRRALPLLLGVMGLVEAGPADVRLHHSRHSLAVHQVTAPWTSNLLRINLDRVLARSRSSMGRRRQTGRRQT